MTEIHLVVRNVWYKALKQSYPDLVKEIERFLEHLQRSGLQDHPEHYVDLVFQYDGAMDAWIVKPQVEY